MGQTTPDSVPERLVIPRDIFNSMVAHCMEGYPNEACGILAGKDMKVTEIFLMTNVESSPVSYLMDPTEQFTVLKELRNRLLSMIAIYHSHPCASAIPSARDIELAFYEEAIYIIVSLIESDFVVKAFSLRSGEVSEVSISVISESHS